MVSLWILWWVNDFLKLSVVAPGLICIQSPHFVYLPVQRLCLSLLRDLDKTIRHASFMLPSIDDYAKEGGSGEV